MNAAKKEKIKRQKTSVRPQYVELLRKYRLLMDLMDQVPDVIYFKDKDGKLLLVNQAHAKGLGLKPQQVVGKTDFDFFPKDRAELMAHDDRRVMKTGKAIIDKVERATRPDGEDNYVSTTKIPRFDEKGRVVGLIGITRDITRRMQIDSLNKEKAVLEKRLEALEELNRVKSDFISVVSHELRTPLAVMKEAVMLILDEVAGSINDKQREVLLKAKDNAERLNRIIGELLDISRIENNRLKLHYSLVNMNALLRDSAEFFQKQAQVRGISLEYVMPQKDTNIFIDAERVNQVITNLINNAIKFTEEGGEIKVELKLLENKVRLGVIDNGAGISKEDLPRIFHKFVQVSKISSAERKGLGLGLSIAKDLVAKHGGELWAESRLGVGSKFYFTLPRFYTLNVLSEEVRGKINNFLNKGINLYLINLFIINYAEFKSRIQVKPKQLSSDLSGIIEAGLNACGHQDEKNPPILINDLAARGECSIIFPHMTDESAAKICDLLKEGIGTYFMRNKIDDAFIALGALSYSDKRQLSLAKAVSANLYVKEIYIGSEMRRHKRVNYKASMSILFAGNKNGASQVIDISEGGLCFESVCTMETDAPISVKLRLFDSDIVLKGRVAWIKKLEDEARGYQIGMQFMDMQDKEKRVLAQLIRRLSSEQDDIKKERQ